MIHTILFITVRCIVSHKAGGDKTNVIENQPYDEF